jgi:hypothetical protein
MEKTMSVILWPPNPSEESWISDVPNEGLCFEEDSIIDTFVDYQGFYLVEPHYRTGSLQFISVTLAPTGDEAYLAAYKIILEEFACCWSNPLPSEADWEAITLKIMSRLVDKGWQRVEYDEKSSTWRKYEG